MFKRLRGLFSGKLRKTPAQDLAFYPMVGSSTVEAPAEATVFWSAETAPGGSLDRTVLAAAPEFFPMAARSAADGLAEAETNPQPLAWPARDASRSQRAEAPADPWQSPAESERLPSPPRRPADDMTVLVARRTRPRPSAS